MIFANVTDIAIPQGNVMKIHETNGGRVLWEKKSVTLTETTYKFVVKATNAVGSMEKEFSITVVG